MTQEIKFTAYLPSGTSRIKKIAGTIQEVLNELSSRNIRMYQIVKESWYDDGTNMEVIIIK